MQGKAIFFAAFIAVLIFSGPTIAQDPYVQFSLDNLAGALVNEGSAGSEVSATVFDAFGRTTVPSWRPRNGHRRGALLLFENQTVVFSSPSALNFDPQSTPFVVSVWASPLYTNRVQSLFSRSLGPIRQIQLSITSANKPMAVVGGQQFVASGPFSVGVGEWHQFTLWNRRAASGGDSPAPFVSSLSVDGVELGSFTPGSEITASAYAQLGLRSTFTPGSVPFADLSAPFYGFLDDFRVYLDDPDATPSAIFAQLQTPESTPLAALVGLHYAFDERQGGNGLTNSGPLGGFGQFNQAGGVTRSLGGAIGSSLHSIGSTTGFVRVQTNPATDLRIGRDEFTVNVWASTQRLSRQSILVARGGMNQQRQLMIRLTATNGVEFLAGQVSRSTAAGIVNDGGWHMYTLVVGQFQRTTTRYDARGFVDGQQLVQFTVGSDFPGPFYNLMGQESDSSSTASSSSSSSSSSLVFPFTGRVDEFRVYYAALSQAEVLQLFATQQPLWNASVSFFQCRIPLDQNALPSSDSVGSCSSSLSVGFPSSGGSGGGGASFGGGLAPMGSGFATLTSSSARILIVPVGDLFGVLNADLNEATISLWAMVAGPPGTTHTLVDATDAAGVSVMAIRLDGSNFVRFFCGDVGIAAPFVSTTTTTTTTTTAAAAARDTWHLYTLTRWRDFGNRCSGYVDGSVAIGFRFSPLVGATAVQTVCVGRCGPYNAASAVLVDDVRVLSRALPDYAVRELFGSSTVFSPSPSVTVTVSRSPSRTPSRTPTTTRSSTRTVTASVSRTPSPTPSISRSVTQSASASASGTASVSGSSSVSGTVTVSSTVTVTPSITGSVTASVTASVTSSQTASVTASESATTTSSVTGSRTASITASVTASVSDISSPTTTPTLTGSVTMTGSSSPTITRTPSESATVTPTRSGTPSSSPTSSQTPTTSPTSSVTPSGSPTASQTPSESPTPTATRSSGFGGCTDPIATNYNPLSVVDDGSCIYPDCSSSEPLSEIKDTSTGCDYQGFGCVGYPPSIVPGTSASCRFTTTTTQSRSVGDPHVTTFQGSYYDNYDCNDYLLVDCERRADAGPTAGSAFPFRFAVVSRQVPYVIPGRTANSGLAIHWWHWNTTAAAYNAPAPGSTTIRTPLPEYQAENSTATKTVISIVAGTAGESRARVFVGCTDVTASVPTVTSAAQRLTVPALVTGVSVLVSYHPYLGGYVVVFPNGLSFVVTPYSAGGRTFFNYATSVTTHANAGRFGGVAGEHCVGSLGWIGNATRASADRAWLSTSGDGSYSWVLSDFRIPVVTVDPFPVCLLAVNSLYGFPSSCLPAHVDYVAPVVAGDECTGKSASIIAMGRACCLISLGSAAIGTPAFDECVRDVCLVESCDPVNAHQDANVVQTQVQVANIPTATSCLQLLETTPTLLGRDGLYSIHPPSPPTGTPNGVVQVFCDMTTDGGGWTRVARIDPSVACPVGWTSASPSAAQSVCRRPDSESDNADGDGNAQCSSTSFTALGIPYTNVRGSLLALSMNRPQAFADPSSPSLSSPISLDGYYVDGVSVTYGSPSRSHLWTFVVGGSDSAVLSGTGQCPCSGAAGASAPSFVGNNWYCESGTPTGSSASGWHTDQILFNRTSCAVTGSSCCSRTPSPSFSRTLTSSSSSPLEVRICTGDLATITNIGVSDLSLHVRERYPDLDVDGDGLKRTLDNCPDRYNPLQENMDGDADGDACDACVNSASNLKDASGLCVCPSGQFDNGRGFCVDIPPTPSITASFSPTRSNTPTQTPTTTASRSISLSSTLTASSSMTISISATRTMLPSVSPSVSVSLSISRSATPTMTPSPSKLNQPDNPAISCMDIKNTNPSAVTGTYWIRPAKAAAAFQVWCDMTSEGGGWTLAAYNFNVRRTFLSGTYSSIGGTLIPTNGQQASMDPAALGLVYNQIGFFINDTQWVAAGTRSYAGFWVGNDTRSTYDLKSNTCQLLWRTSTTQWNGQMVYFAGDGANDNGCNGGGSVFTSTHTCDDGGGGITPNVLAWAQSAGDSLWGFNCVTSYNPTGAHKASPIGNQDLHAYYVRYYIDATAQYGKSKWNPGKSCSDILDKFPSSTTGSYWIDPTTSGNAFQVWCDMTSEGGGWTLAAYNWNVRRNFLTGTYSSVGGTLIPTNGQQASMDPDAVGLFYNQIAFFINDTQWVAAGTRSYSGFWVGNDTRSVYNLKSNACQMLWRTSTTQWNGQMVYFAGDGANDNGCSGGGSVFTSTHTCDDGGGGITPNVLAWAGSGSDSLWGYNCVSSYSPTGAYKKSAIGNQDLHAYYVRYKADPSVPLGSSRLNPATSCKDLITRRPGVPSGAYFLYIANTIAQYWCEMTLDGGGWTLAAYNWNVRRSFLSGTFRAVSGNPIPATGTEWAMEPKSLGLSYTQIAFFTNDSSWTSAQRTYQGFWIGNDSRSTYDLTNNFCQLLYPTQSGQWNGQLVYFAGDGSSDNGCYGGGSAFTTSGHTCDDGGGGVTVNVVSWASSCADPLWGCNCISSYDATGAHKFNPISQTNFTGYYIR